jgi:uncharacterized protein
MSSNKKDIYWFPPVEEWVWKNFDRNKVVSVDKFIEDHRLDDFYIGTDSNIGGGHANFNTSLIAYRNGTGGFIACYNQRTLDKGMMRPRLLSEAMRSLTLAYYLDTRIPKESVIEIHLDVNADPHYKSNMCKEELVGMILAQGERFRPMWKPEAWGANKVAHNGT